MTAVETLFLSLSVDARAAIVRHGEASYPDECCGVIAGKDGVATRVVPMTNAERSPTGFVFDPQEQLRVWRSLEPFSRTYLTLAGPDSDPQWSADLHDPMLDAVRAKDADALVAAIEAHFDEVRESLGRRLSEHPAHDEPGAAEPGR